MEINIGIDKTQRHEVSEGLSRVLADTYTLYLKTHKYHWNVTGPNFSSLHLLFEGQYNELWIATDTIAERIRTLGALAPGSYAEFESLTSIKEASSTPPAEEMIADLVDGHEAVTRTIRSVFPIAEKAEDEATADLLTQRLEVHEKTAWMLRAHVG